MIFKSLRLSTQIPQNEFVDSDDPSHDFRKLKSTRSGIQRGKLKF